MQRTIIRKQFLYNIIPIEKYPTFIMNKCYIIISHFVDKKILIKITFIDQI